MIKAVALKIQDFLLLDLPITRGHAIALACGIVSFGLDVYSGVTASSWTYFWWGFVPLLVSIVLAWRGDPTSDTYLGVIGGLLTIGFGICVASLVITWTYPGAMFMLGAGYILAAGLMIPSAILAASNG